LRNHTVETWKPEGGPDVDLVRAFRSPSVQPRLIRITAAVVSRVRAYPRISVP
jgi:hypothetical protein